MVNADCDDKHSYICGPRNVKHSNNTKKLTSSKVTPISMKVTYKTAKTFCRRMNGRLPRLNLRDMRRITAFLNAKGKYMFIFYFLAKICTTWNDVT